MFRRNEKPVATSYLDSREQAGTLYVVGTLQARVGGRVVDIHIPKGSPPQELTFDLNTAYSFLCAHSGYFNCPLVLTNNLDVELKFGEKYPPLFSGNFAKR